MAGTRMVRDCIKEEGRGKERKLGSINSRETNTNVYVWVDKHTHKHTWMGGLWGIFCHPINDNSVMGLMNKHGSITPSALRQ